MARAESLSGITSPNIKGAFEQMQNHVPEELEGVCLPHTWTPQDHRGDALSQQLKQSAVERAGNQFNQPAAAAGLARLVTSGQEARRGRPCRASPGSAQRTVPDHQQPQKASEPQHNDSSLAEHGAEAAVRFPMIVRKLRHVPGCPCGPRRRRLCMIKQDYPGTGSATATHLDNVR